MLNQILLTSKSVLRCRKKDKKTPKNTIVNIKFTKTSYLDGNITREQAKTMNLNFLSASCNLTRRDKRKAKGKMHELSPKGGSTRLQLRRQTTAPIHHRRRTPSKETQSLLGYRTEWRPDVSSQEMKN